jgi:hypothetical protein
LLREDLQQKNELEEGKKEVEALIRERKKWESEDHWRSGSYPYQIPWGWGATKI